VGENLGRGHRHADQGPGQCRRVAAGFQREGGHLVCMIYPPSGGRCGAGTEGAVVDGWRGGTFSSFWTNTFGAQARAPGGFDSGRLAADVLCLVEWCSAAINVRENWVRNLSQESSGEFKNLLGKRSG
jgi:hypothetical protein